MQAFESVSYREQMGRLKSLARAALDAYPLQAESLRLLGNFDNTTFRVDDQSGERYVLRIHRTSHSPSHPKRTPTEVRSEMIWLAALNQAIGPVAPAPVATLDGELLTVVEVRGVPEPRICVLFRWVQGRFFDTRLAPAHLEQVGRFMAGLHGHAEQFVPPEGFVRGRTDEVSDEVSQFFTGTVAELYGQDDVEVVQAVIRKVREAQRDLDKEPRTFGLIHGDLHQENYLFHKGQVRAIDFDDCGWGYFLYDLAVTLSELWDRHNYADLRAALLKGYEGAHPLPAGHEQHLQTLDALRLLQLTVHSLDQRSNQASDDWEAAVRGGLDELKAFVLA